MYIKKLKLKSQNFLASNTYNDTNNSKINIQLKLEGFLLGLMKSQLEKSHRLFLCMIIAPRLLYGGMVSEDERTSRDGKIRERSTTTFITDWKPLVHFLLEKKKKNPNL